MERMVCQGFSCQIFPPCLVFPLPNYPNQAPCIGVFTAQETYGTIFLSTECLVQVTNIPKVAVNPHRTKNESKTASANLRVHNKRQTTSNNLRRCSPLPFRLLLGAGLAHKLLHLAPGYKRGTRILRILQMLQISSHTNFKTR
jgi:hypothetical protein